MSTAQDTAPQIAAVNPTAGKSALTVPLVASLVTLALLIIVPMFMKNFFVFQLTIIVIYAIAILSLNILTGASGQFSLGHSAFFALGAYGAGMAHTHPGGEFDLCFAVSGSPTFDGRPEGWTVYAPGSWHVPTVQGGVMDILYFLPAGAMKFGPQPEGATAVGLQAPR